MGTSLAQGGLWFGEIKERGLEEMVKDLENQT